ncbi:hypothetical protein IAD21_01842 [Abditibacteriota bacterium]|nr:hypothetical protein IAD21_01842 [Abditibacteriota bacterium]
MKPLLFLPSHAQTPPHTFGPCPWPLPFSICSIGVPITTCPYPFTPTVEASKRLNSQYSILQTPLLSVNFPKNHRVFTQNGPTINLSRSFCALHPRINHAQD